MDLECVQQYKGFKLLQQEYIEEVEGIGRVLKHERSGITIINLSNKDPHKVFCVAFHTPPESNNGAPHIVEHTVCCASKKYPLKETFMALEKGSICTTLNACTYPDMTMYYGASLSEKDLSGIMKVYMDMVFHPLMKEDERLFAQEGWHYTLDEGELGISGVVYHEMQGEYGEATTRLEHALSKALFPDTHYRFDAGGIPQEIVGLSYNEFLAFHEKYYVPQNSVIYLYGNMDLKEQLQLLEESCLKELPSLSEQTIRRNFEGKCQKTPNEPLYVTEAYPADLEENQTLMSLSFVIGTALDAELRLAFELLEHMLLRSSASPLAKAIVVDRHLGVSLGEGGYDTSRYQPVFSISLKGAAKNQGRLFEETVLETLQKLVKEGIDEDLIEAALHTLAFELKEVDASYEPVGLQYGEMILNSYLYGGKPFIHLKYKEPVEKIKLYKAKGYFEALIQKYLLNNKHRVLVVLNPSHQLAKEEHDALEKSLATYESSLTDNDKTEIVNRMWDLEQMQMMQNTEADLRCLPYLKKEDLNLEIIPIHHKEINDAPFKYYFQEEETKGIAYIHILFDTRIVPEEDLPYLGLLGHLLTYVGTANMDYQALENAINRITGGMNCSLQAYNHLETNSYKPYFKITSKVLIEEVEKWRILMQSILTESIFIEKGKIKEIIGNIQYELGRSFEGAPEYRATRRVFAFFSPAGQYEDIVSGIRFYQFIKAFYEQFEIKYDEVMGKVVQLYKKIMCKQGLMAYVTAPKSEEVFLQEQIFMLGNSLEDCMLSHYQYQLALDTKREAYCTMQKVEAIAKGFNFIEAGFSYHGVLEVAAHIIESTYLWDRIRLQGGAYGCDLLVSRDGNLVICSYCDPKLAGTLEVFDGIGDLLRNLQLEDRELERYIIHTIGTMQAPMSMEQKSERGLMYTLCGMSTAQLEQAMQEILNTNLEQIRGLASLFDAFKEAPYLCVVGSKKQIKKHKKYFDCIID